LNYLFSCFNKYNNARKYLFITEKHKVWLSILLCVLIRKLLIERSFFVDKTSKCSLVMLEISAEDCSRCLSLKKVLKSFMKFIY